MRKAFPKVCSFKKYIDVSLPQFLAVTAAAEIPLRCSDLLQGPPEVGLASVPGLLIGQVWQLSQSFQLAFCTKNLI